VFDYGNNIRQRAFDNGFAEAFAFPGFVPHSSGLNSAWVAAVPLGGAVGDPQDIRVTDEAILELFPFRINHREHREERNESGMPLCSL